MKHLAEISTPHLAIPDLRADKNVTATDFEKATLLAKYFASQCTSTAPPEHLNGAPFPLPEKQPIFDFLPIPKLTVLRTLRHRPPHLQSNGAPPHHQPSFSRVCTNHLPLYYASVQPIYHYRRVPRRLEHATVTPIFKNRGTAGDPSNYRPVSLLPAVGKVLDRIQSSCLLQHLVQHSPHQFGFIPGKSTTMQLIYLIHRWLQALEKGHKITAVFLDFKKAFDHVWHHGLLHKLLTCGISPKSVTWISSYLTNRQISVKVRNTFSEFHPITRGVPQGSHLGLILFIVFINDLIPSVAISTEVYADDTTLHQQHQKTPKCQSYL